MLYLTRCDQSSAIPVQRDPLERKFTFPIEGEFRRIGRKPCKHASNFPLLFICGGAGTGKTSAIELLQEYGDAIFFCKTTTRDPRPQEKSGNIASNFITFKQFIQLEDEKIDRYEEMVVSLFDPEWKKVAERANLKTPEIGDVIKNLSQFIAVFKISELEQTIKNARCEKKIICLELRLKDAIRLKEDFPKSVIINLVAPEKEIFRRIEQTRKGGFKKTTNIIKFVEAICSSSSIKAPVSDYYEIDSGEYRPIEIAEKIHQIMMKKMRLR